MTPTVNRDSLIDGTEQEVLQRDTAEPDDSLVPIVVEFGICDASAGRGVVEAFFVNDDSDVSKLVEKHEIAKPVTLLPFDRFKRLPINSRACPRKLDSDIAKNSPDKT